MGLLSLGWPSVQGASFSLPMNMNDSTSPNLIGGYGPWAAGLAPEIPAFSFRHEKWKDQETWQAAARQRLAERIAEPDLGPAPKVEVLRQVEYDGLEIEHLQWKLPTGYATEATLLKPQNAQEPLPGILGLHDHGGNKYFGRRKITRTGQGMHPMMREHQQQYYGGKPWANELAKRGYVVLVPDAFPFASRRVRLEDVPAYNRHGLEDVPLDTEPMEAIHAYNRWAGEHESIMAKSLFCAGTTWPGVYLAEDRLALDILAAREEVDAERLGCGGLSGGGMRTVYLGGTDSRIKCAVCVGFMTTWRDFMLNKAFTHTWMAYVPLLPNELDFPEILGMRVPLPTLVQNDREDFLYTLPEMQRADEQLAAIYEKAGAPERYRCRYYPGDHKFDLTMQAEAFDWFDQWLG